MTALPPQNTARFWLAYHDGHNEHEMLVRYDSSIVGIGDVMTAVDNLWLAIADSWFIITVLGARHAASGSVLSFPITWSGLSSYGGGGMSGEWAPRQFCLLGRDNSGRRFRLFLFGYEGSTPTSFRMARSAANTVDDALTLIEAEQANGIFQTISNKAPVMYQYADFNFNNYYERKVRG